MMTNKELLKKLNILKEALQVHVYKYFYNKITPENVGDIEASFNKHVMEAASAGDEYTFGLKLSCKKQDKVKIERIRIYKDGKEINANG